MLKTPNVISDVYSIGAIMKLLLKSTKTYTDICSKLAESCLQIDPNKRIQFSKLFNIFQVYLCIGDKFNYISRKSKRVVHSTITDKNGIRHYVTCWILYLPKGKFPISLFLISGFPFFDLHNSWLKNAVDIITEKCSYSLEFYISLLFNGISFLPNKNNVVDVCYYDAISDNYISHSKSYNFLDLGLNLYNQSLERLLNKIDFENILSLINLLLF